MNWVRIVKSPQEIAYMRQAGVIAEQAMNVAIESIEVGVRQCDVAAAIYAATVGGTAEFGGDMPEAPWMPSGERTSAPHLTWTDERISRWRSDERRAERRPASLHRRAGANGDPGCSRTEAEGDGPGRDRRSQHGLDRARPGVTCHDVEAAWREVASANGIEKSSRIGYSIGIGYPAPAGTSARPACGDDTVLEPNMTFHMIIGLWMDDWGFELSETFRVTDDGAPEVFSHVPREVLSRSSKKTTCRVVSSPMRSQFSFTSTPSA